MAAVRPTLTRAAGRRTSAPEIGSTQRPTASDLRDLDIPSLKATTQREPANGHGWFVLAQACQDAGRFDEAAQAYRRRADMVDGSEEAWCARVRLARCLLQMGDDAGFVSEALAAYNQYPARAEPLYDLARFYRTRGMNEAGALFAETGMAAPHPAAGAQFVDDFIYAVGLKEEYSILANYARDAARKQRGRTACNFLSLQRGIPVRSRDLARRNLRYYGEPVRDLAPSFSTQPVGFEPAGGYRPINPSVTCAGGQLIMIQRASGQTLDEYGAYHSLGLDKDLPKNYLLRLNADLSVASSTPILPPKELPAPRFREAGPMDLRLFCWRDELWCVGNIAELTDGERWVNQVLARLDTSADRCRLVDCRVLTPPGPRLIEKNWTPRVSGNALNFIYLCDPTRVLDDQARIIRETIPSIAAEDFRGNTQAIAFDGGWLTVIHQVAFQEGRGRLYFHRFVWFDEADTLRRVSRQFFFNRRGVEFAVGLTWRPDGRKLLISYGVQDAESWIAAIDGDDVRAMLEDANDLPWGGPG